MRTTDSLEKVIDDFIDEIYAQPQSKRIYRSHIRTFVYWCHDNNINPREPSDKDMVKFEGKVKIEKHNEYKRSLLQTIKRFWKWVESKNYYHNVCKNMPIPNSSNDFTRLPLSKKQANDLLKSIPIDSKVGKRDRLMTAILLITGIRVVELSRLRTQDISNIGETKGFYYQPKGKTDKNHFKPLDDKLYSRLDEYIRENNIDGDDMAIFCSDSNSNRNQPLSAKAICNIISKRMKKANLKSKHICVHSLRHTSGTLASLKGYSSEQIQGHYSHSSIKMTQRYIREALRQKNLQNQIGKDISDILEY